MDKLPKGWKIIFLPEIVLPRKTAIKRGPFGSSLKKEFFVSEGYKVYEQKHAIKNDFSLGEYFINEAKFIELKDFELIPGDIIISCSGTIGKVAIMPENAHKGIINQALLKISIDEKKINKSFFIRWFENYVSQDVFLDSIKGAAIKNIASVSELKTIPIPVPISLSEQTRIVSKLDTLFGSIDKSIALLAENIEHTKGLMASVLEEIFANGKNWKREPLNKVAKVERGKSKHRPRNDQKLFGDSYPFIQTGDVRSANKYIDKYEVCYSEFGLRQSRLWNKGTICLTIAANIGDVAILGFDACFPDSVVGITPNSMNNEFLYYYLKTLQLQLDKKANSAAQKNINLKILSEIDVPVPSIEIQNSIADRFSRLEEKQFQILSVQQSKLTYLKALKSSLLDRAFKGDL